VRVVLWTNEENGTRGGNAYRDEHRAELSNHVLMLESDNGVSRPLGFGFSGSDTSRQKIRAIATLLRGIAADSILPGGGGADINPSVREARIPSLALAVGDSKYFLIHHTPADTVDKIDPVEMARCAATVAVATYVVADLPDGRVIDWRLMLKHPRPHFRARDEPAARSACFHSAQQPKNRGRRTSSRRSARCRSR
jgi:carboxypeptidase Q